MEYKRSKALYLGILAGIALLAGVAHQRPSEKLISVQIKNQNPNLHWVAKANESINPTSTENEEAKPNTTLLID